MRTLAYDLTIITSQCLKSQVRSHTCQSQDAKTQAQEDGAEVESRAPTQVSMHVSRLGLRFLSRVNHSSSAKSSFASLRLRLGGEMSGGIEPET